MATKKSQTVKKKAGRKPKAKSAGQPPKYETPQQLQAAIGKYFKSGVKKREVIVGKGDAQKVVKIKVPTITGLCIYLGFESRQSFYDYEKRLEFSYTIKRARLFIENNYEELLQVGNVTGAIFALKNFDWSDKQEIQHSGAINTPEIVIERHTNETKI